MAHLAQLCACSLRVEKITTTALVFIFLTLIRLGVEVEFILKFLNFITLQNSPLSFGTRHSSGSNDEVTIAIAVKQTAVSTEILESTIIYLYLVNRPGTGLPPAPQRAMHFCSVTKLFPFPPSPL